MTPIPPFPPLPESFIKPETWNYEGVEDRNPLRLRMASFCKQRKMHIIVSWQVVGERGYHFSIKPICTTTYALFLTHTNGRATLQEIQETIEEIKPILENTPLTRNSTPSADIFISPSGIHHIVQTS